MEKRKPLNQWLDWAAREMYRDGLLTREDAKKLLVNASRPPNASVHPYVSLADYGLTNQKTGKPLSVEAITRWVAGKHGMDYLKIDPTRINVGTVSELVSQAYASKHKILPVAVDGDTITFAVADPENEAWIEELQRLLRADIKRVHANPLDIQRYLFEFYGVNRSIQHAKAQHKSRRLDPILNLEQMVQLGSRGDLSADDQHVINIVDWLLQYAFEQRASDIHLEPKRDESQVRFRIDGKLHQVYTFPAAVMAAVVSRIKILSRMDVAEKRKPQDGRIKTVSGQNREVELRVSTMPTVFGEKCVMRIFDPDAVVKTYRELGFSESEETLWNSMIDRPHGIVLVTGPTGSGKTTTLYSTLKRLASGEVNVSTVEDPIEMVFPELNQMQVNAKIGLNFADGIRTLMRQDPDIIMVGEIRDLETAQMAVQASLTGHLVLSTLHTNSAPGAINRLLDLGVPDYLLRSTLAGVIAQRLARKLCPHCKREVATDAASWEALVHPFDVPMPDTIHEKVGCLECRNTGYHGRLGVYEMMPVSERLRERIQHNTPSEKIAEAAIAEGMKPLRLALAQHIAEGRTTLEEAIKLTPQMLQ
jgi:general secretion pathway protein E